MTRCDVFLAAHPDITITRPGEYTYWVARRGGFILAAELDLDDLLDDLDQLTGQDGGGDG